MNDTENFGRKRRRNRMCNTIIFATSNEGKMKEVRMILSDLGMEVLSLKDAGIQVDIVEDGKTFEENAIIKVNEIRPFTNGIILADDSGLEVDALDKKPGIYSARFMGEDTPYTVKNQAIIDAVKDVAEEKRTARFVCAIAAGMPDGSVVTTRGTIEGIIAHQPAGEGGFGYDPIVYVPELHKTTAELTPEQKNEVSHRGKALRAMKEEIRKYQKREK